MNISFGGQSFFNSDHFFSKKKNLFSDLSRIFVDLSTLLSVKMLYNVDLLRKDGRFGVLWHLGSTGSTSSNVSKKLKRKLVDRVVVRRMCEEVTDLLPVSALMFLLNPDILFILIRTLLFGSRPSKVVFKAHKSQIFNYSLIYKLLHSRISVFILYWSGLVQT